MSILKKLVKVTVFLFAAAGFILVSLLTIGYLWPPKANTSNTASPSFEDIECPLLSDVRNTTTPADLLPAIQRCVRGNQYDRAARLAALAAIYIRFDQQRLSDPSLDDYFSVWVLTLSAPMSEDQRKQFVTTQKAIRNDPQAWRAFCAASHQIGPPTYYPKYMIDHGMGAFQRTSYQVFKSDFNAKQAWHELETTYVHCEG